MSMKNETAIVTGSTSGIGKKIAELFLDEGCKVAICSRNEENVETTVAEFRKKYGNDSVIGFPCDVSRIEDIKNVTGKTVEAFGSVRILVANAGLNMTYGPFSLFTPEKAASDAQAVINANLIGTVNSVAAVLPQMIKQKYGRIITLAGAGADHKRPVAHMSLYAASKGGVVSFSLSLAEEFKHNGNDIKINIFYPGMIETNLSRRSKPVEGWKTEEEFQNETSAVHNFLGTDISESCRKVIPYALPACQESGKSFRGFSIMKMIRGGRKLQKTMKETRM